MLAVVTGELRMRYLIVALTYPLNLILLLLDKGIETSEV